MVKKPKKFKRGTSKRKLEVRGGKLESPKNNRIIAEKLLSFPVWFYSLSIIALIGVLLLSLNLQKESQQLVKVNEQRKAVELELWHWQQIDKQYPGSKDINVKLATIVYRLGDFEKAKMYTEKALSLDPNDEQAREMQAILKKKVPNN